MLNRFYEINNSKFLDKIFVHSKGMLSTNLQFIVHIVRGKSRNEKSYFSL